MSTTPAPSAPPGPPEIGPKSEIRIVAHSTLFYWWPVWSVGFILAGITAFSEDRLAIVPQGTTP